MDSAAGPELDHPVRRGDHVQMMLHDQHAVPGVAQAEKRFQQPLDIAEMQAGGRLVEEIERVRCLGSPSSTASLSRCASPPESVFAGLAELQIAESEFLQRCRKSGGFSESVGKTPAPRSREAPSTSAMDFPL